MNPDELIALNDEIAGMARAGLPLDQGLAALAREMGRGRLRAVTAQLASDLKAGHPLPEALDRLGKRVPSFYGSLVTAGIRTGRIADVLATLSLYARSIASLRAIIIDALFYPCIVLVFGAVLLALMGAFLLPQFDQLYLDFQMKMPAATEWALRFSRHPLQMIVIPIAFLALVFTLAYWSMRLTERGRCHWATIVYSVPILGTLVRSARVAAFTDLLAILIDHEIPLPEAFRLAGEASSDPIMAYHSRDIYEELNQGKSLGEAIRGRGLVPNWVAWMTGLGESHGSLGKSLRQVAEMYRRQVEMRAGLLRNVLPAFLILLIGGFLVSLFVMTGVLPMMKLLEGLSM